MAIISGLYLAGLCFVYQSHHGCSEAGLHSLPQIVSDGSSTRDEENLCPCPWLLTGAGEQRLEC